MELIKSSEKSKDWSDWRWQLRRRIRSSKELNTLLPLTEDENQAIDQIEGPLPLGITPYYLSLIDPNDPQDPLRKTLIPSINEFKVSAAESIDPLGEEPYRPVPAIVHRYPDRVLFLMTGFCAVYCRYCTRGRLVGDQTEYGSSKLEWEKAIEYIASNPQIRDVLVTGGDPLTESDSRLEWVLSRLHAIPHVEYVRIGSKVPVALPMRVTNELCDIIKKYHPVWLSLHINHPRELTKEACQAITRLVDAGVPIGSQTVLLKAVNDNSQILKELFHRLIQLRVKPYYLFHCDPIKGSAHFRTSIQKGIDLMGELRGHTSGYAIPTYAIDIAGSGGKIPLLPEYIVEKNHTEWTFKNFRGELHTYPDGSD